MSGRIEIRPQAYVDLAEIAEFLAKTSPAAARRFLLAAEATFDWLSINSGAGAIYGFEHALATDVRAWRVQRFKNHLIFYREVSRGIQVVRVLHGARDIDAIFSEGG